MATTQYKRPAGEGEYTHALRWRGQAQSQRHQAENYVDADAAIKTEQLGFAPPRIRRAATLRDSLGAQGDRFRSDRAESDNPTSNAVGAALVLERPTGPELAVFTHIVEALVVRRLGRPPDLA